MIGDHKSLPLDQIAIHGHYITRVCYTRKQTTLKSVMEFIKKLHVFERRDDKQDTISVS